MLTTFNGGSAYGNTNKRKKKIKTKDRKKKCLLKSNRIEKEYYSFVLY